MTGRAGAAVAVLATTLLAVPATACPAFDNRHVPPVSVEQPSDPAAPFSYLLETIAAGEIDIERCRSLPIESRGFVDRRGHLSLRMHRHDTHLLRIRVSAPCDTILLVNDAAGDWRFDDDGGGGTDPALDIAWPLEGLHDIWVGSYDGGPCAADLMLSLEPRPSS